MKSFLKGVQKMFKRTAQVNPHFGLMILFIVAFIGVGPAFGSTQSRLQPLSNPIPVMATPSPDPTLTPLEPTPLPRELIDNQKQTIGLTLAAAALVLIVVIGVFTAFVKFPGDNHV